MNVHTLLLVSTAAVWPTYTLGQGVCVAFSQEAISLLAQLHTAVTI